MSSTRASRDRASEQLADRGLTDARGRGDVPIAQTFSPQREEQSIALGKLPQRLARRPEPAVLVWQSDRRNAGVVPRRPGQPALPSPLSIPGRVRGDGEQPASQVAGIAFGAQVLDQLEERLLNARPPRPDGAAGAPRQTDRRPRHAPGTSSWPRATRRLRHPYFRTFTCITGPTGACDSRVVLMSRP